jgi:chromosome segregation ATPase
MFFVLGVLVAGLLGLMILPALWRRAVYLSMRRLEMQTPLSMDEVLADRDLLRAEHAVGQVRLEERLARAQEAHARDRADLGRHLATYAAHAKTLSALHADHAGTQAQLDAALAQVIDLQAQLGAAMIEVHDGLTARARYDTLSLEVVRHQRIAADRQLVVAGLEMRLAGTEATLRETLHQLAEREQTLMARERHLSDLDETLARVNRKLALAERKRGHALLKTDDAGLRTSMADLGSEVQRIAKAIEARPARSKQAKKKAAGKGARVAVD